MKQKMDGAYFWNKEWGPVCFSETMNRNDCTENTRFIRFYKKTQRS